MNLENRKNFINKIENPENDREITRQEVVESLRAHPENLMLLQKFLEQEEARAEKTSKGNLNIAILEIDIFEEAGMYEAAYNTCEQTIGIAEQFDLEQEKKLIERIRGLQSKILSASLE